jgi:hypothetical protein
VPASTALTAGADVSGADFRDVLPCEDATGETAPLFGNYLMWPPAHLSLCVGLEGFQEERSRFWERLTADRLRRLQGTDSQKLSQNAVSRDRYGFRAGTRLP